MNNEIIAISPIVDRTEEAYGHTTKKRNKNHKRRKKAIMRFLSMTLSMNFILCAVFFTGNQSTRDLIKDKLISSLFYGGYLPKAPIDEKKDDISIPTNTEPDNIADDKSDNEENSTLEAFLKLYEYDLSIVPDGLYPIIPYDLSRESDGELKLFNDTSLDIDLNELKNRETTVEASVFSHDEPTVLIIHTHGTEAYSEEGVLGYSDTYNIPRSHDVTKNVIAIGRYMVKVFEENGVSAIHCDIMHDAESYLGAYSRSAETIKRYIAKYPSIKYVFDIHRDSILLEDKTKTRPITIANGKVAAQIMTVAGSNELGTYHPDWEKNLVFAAKLQESLNENYLGLARSVCLRGSSYNQELAPCSLLFEVGSCGNTLSEAMISAELLTIELSNLIKSGW